jgi:hypothetical protein
MSDDILFGLVLASRMIGLGASLVEAWTTVGPSLGSEEGRGFFEKLLSNWYGLPMDQPIRVHPTFQERETESLDWKILARFTLIGEASGMLDDLWIEAPCLILLHRRMRAAPPSRTDVELALHLARFWDDPSNLIEDLALKDWAADEHWLDQKSGEAPLAVGKDIGLLWLRENGDMSPADIPAPVSAGLRKSITSAGLPEEKLQDALVASTLFRNALKRLPG